MPAMNSKAVRPVAGRLLRQAEQRQRRGEVGQRHERGGLLRRAREELQHRRRDDAERALRADEQIVQVVAGVVLLQRLRPFQTWPSASTTSRPSTSWRALP